MHPLRPVFAVGRVATVAERMIFRLSSARFRLVRRIRECDAVKGRAMLAPRPDMTALARRVGEPMRGSRAVAAREGRTRWRGDGPRLANRARRDDGEGRPGVGGRSREGPLPGRAICARCGVARRCADPRWTCSSPRWERLEAAGAPPSGWGGPRCAPGPRASASSSSGVTVIGRSFVPLGHRVGDEIGMTCASGPRPRRLVGSGVAIGRAHAPCTRGRELLDRWRITAFTSTSRRSTERPPPRRAS